MKKGILLVLGCIAGSLYATETTQSVVTRTEVQSVSLSKEEQAFVAKLSESGRKVFNQLSAEKRQAVLALTKDTSLSADAALEKALKQNQIAEVKTEVKVTEKK